ncbi:hypothetical protein HW555_013563 [Spodoptera exigua]|uniref:Regulatory protein zeste n=1 Tax=Spodoptera exigua TaxID=7107 RepID=A0A835G192_SPOEX|nr:hypothetical protein HW555_013563 [Spodoptera exigua]
MDIDKLVKQRSGIKAKLTNFEKYITILSSSKLISELQRIDLEGRLSKFEALYDIFDALQMEIELASANPEDEYVERNQIEERYHSLIASARSQLRTSGSQRKGSETGTTMDSKPGFIEKLHEGVCVCNRKYTDTNTNKSKTAAWQTVMKRFNELNSRQRELAEIKQQWRTMKLDAKKNMSQNSESQLDLGTQEFVVTEVDNRDTAKENIIPLRKPQTTLNNRVSSVNCHLVMDIDQLLCAPDAYVRFLTLLCVPSTHLCVQYVRASKTIKTTDRGSRDILLYEEAYKEILRPVLVLDRPSVRTSVALLICMKFHKSSQCSTDRTHAYIATHCVRGPSVERVRMRAVGRPTRYGNI